MPRPIPVAESPDAVRAMVQYFNTVHVTRESKVIKEVKAIAEIFELAPPEADDWRKLIGKANKVFQFVQMTIKAMISEVNGQIYWGLVNTAHEDAPSVVFPEKEVKLFQAVFKTLIDQKGTISQENALDLRCRDGQHKLTIEEARMVLQKLCTNHWLRPDKDGNYLIGERAYLEYGSYFDRLHQGGELPTCSSCKHWMILGTDENLHYHCQERIRE